MALAVDLDYSSLQDIREESGQQHLVRLENPSGLVNGSNTIFTVGRTYIVDRNYNDTIDVGVSGDVIVYDDNVAVSVASVDTTTGVITLTAAPVTASVIKISYAYSLLSDAAVTKYRNEAISWVQRKLSGIIDYTVWTDTTIPDEIKTIVRNYAAAWILIKDQGFNTDTENSSKDGYKRLTIAKDMLAEYLDEVSTASGSSVRVTVSSRSDGNLFYRNTDLTDYNESVGSTEFFMRDEQ
jgi:hypothetical protein